MRKKIFLFCLIILFSIHVSLALEVTREMLSSIDPGADLNVIFNVDDISEGEEIELSETIPQEFAFSNWDITGTNTSTEDILEINGNVYTWSFTSNNNSATITYTVFVPVTVSGDYTFTSEWNGNTEEKSINVKKAATSSPFDKKTKKSPLVIILAAIAVVGLTVFGVYMQKKKKSGGVKKIKVKEAEPKEKKPTSKTPEEHKIERMEYVEKASHELPSFTEEASLIELPSLEEKKLPPVFKTEEKEAHEGVAEKIKKADSLLNKVLKKRKK